MGRTAELPFTRQVTNMVLDCRVELAALALALMLTFLAFGMVSEVRTWDANGVVLLVGALWMAICVLLYRLLDKTPR